MFEKNTEELFNALKEDPDVEQFLANNQQEFSEPLHIYLKKLLAEKNLTIKYLCAELNCSPAHIYHIFSGAKKPSRQRIVAISRAMNLNLEETQYLLRYGGYGILYPRNPWDAVVISSIEHNLSVAEMNELLRQLGEIPIFNEE